MIARERSDLSLSLSPSPSQSKIKKLHTLYVICNYVIIMPVSSTGLYGLGDFAAKIIYTIILYE